MRTALRSIRPLLAAASVALAVWQVSLLLTVLRGGADAQGVESAAAKRGPFIVGVTREGRLESADVTTVRAPMSGSTLTWLIDDGATVKKGDLIAKVDVGEYRFEVERTRLEQQNSVRRIDQEKRDRGREYESAQLGVDRTLRGLDVLTRSQLTESEQAKAQIGFDNWNVAWARTDYDKQSRLSQAGIVPQTTVDQSERSLRSREYGLARSEKSASYLDAEHASKKKQSESDIDTAKFEADLAQRRIGEAVKGARNRANLVTRQLQEMEQELSGGELRSPAAGVVVLGKTWGETGRRTWREGDRVWSRQKVADITNLSALEVRLQVDENSVHRIRPKQKAVITLKAVPGKHFDAEVIAVGAVAHMALPWEDASAVPGQRVFDVSVKISKPDLTILRPGVKVDVQFVFDSIPDAIYVPVQAVHDRPDGQVVYVQQGRRFVPRRIRIGERNDKSVIILEGVKAGERVALGDPTRAGAS
ncbi:MAG: efflux RND transporter periplasmic adaptor subunit [Armatimonadota bacterium]